MKMLNINGMENLLLLMGEDFEFYCLQFKKCNGDGDLALEFELFSRWG